MNPITHFFVGWVALEKCVDSNRDKALVCMAGVIPDLDGLGIVVDFATRMLGWPETNYYQDYHRLFGHGLPAALLIAVVAAALAIQRARVAGLALIAAHLHFLCDLLGSRGSGADDLWPIHYLAPTSMAVTLSWPHQWPLVGWQNLLLSVILMFVLMTRAAAREYSPLVLVSRRADLVFVATLRDWRRRTRRSLGLD